MTAAPQKEPKTGPSSHAIEIHHDGKAFAYKTADNEDGAKITVRTGDLIKWTSRVGNYSILFKDKSPFKEIAAHGLKENDTALFEVTAPKGEYHYHYGVTLVLPDKSMIVDDPVIIVGGGADGF